MKTRTPEERLLMWLQDAYAMEHEAETMLESMAGRIENYPELKARIEAHAEETRSQAERLTTCITRLDGTVPVARGMVADLLAGMHAAGNALMSDEVAKGLGISYAFEHMEIASYRALVIAAREAGQDDIAEICEDILSEEIEMADWLIDHQEDLVLEFLERESSEGVTAKH